MTNIISIYYPWLSGVMTVKSQASYLQSTQPAGGPSGQAGLEQTEVRRWLRAPDVITGLGLSLNNEKYTVQNVWWTQSSFSRNYLMVDSRLLWNQIPTVI